MLLKSQCNEKKGEKKKKITITKHQHLLSWCGHHSDVFLEGPFLTGERGGVAVEGGGGGRRGTAERCKRRVGEKRLVGAWTVGSRGVVGKLG